MRRPTHALALLSAMAWTVPGRGGDNPDADAMFRDGRRLFEEGHVDEACARFADSQRIDPKLGTLLNLAICREQQGRFASAWAAFAAVEQLATAAGETDRASFARDRVHTLVPKLSRVIVSMPSSLPEVVVTIGGRPIGAAELGVPLPVDPGELDVAADAPGKKRWRARVHVEPGPSTTQLVVPALEDAPAAAPALAPPNTRASRERDRTRFTVGLVAGNVGVAALAVGTYFGIRAASRKSDGDGHCDGTLCDQEGLELQSSARSSATVATVAFGIGLIGVGAGAFLLLSPTARPPKRSAAGARVSAGPWIAGRGIVLEGIF